MINFYPGQYFTEDEVERVCDSAKETKRQYHVTIYLGFVQMNKKNKNNNI